MAVRSLADLDWETALTVRSLCRRHGVGDPVVYVGCDPKAPSPTLDDNGLVWRMDTLTVRETVLALRSHPSTTVEEVEDGNPHDAAFGLGTATVADDPEPEAFARLSRAEIDGGGLSAVETQWIVGAQLASFRRFGFVSAIGIGLRLLATESALDGAARGQVHGIVGLAAHNRQFQTAGNHRLSAFLTRHFEAALRHETRPERRVAIHYRLAVTTGRRRGDLEACLAWCRRGRAELRAAELPVVRAAHLDAWIGNIRAYGLMRQQRLEEALAETAASFTEMARARAFAHDGDTEPEICGWSREMGATQSLLAHNHAALSAKAGDGDAYVHWRRKATAIEAEEDGAARWEAGYWIAWYRGQRRPDLGLVEALKGLRSAEAELDVANTFRFGLEAADFAYRLGRADYADRLFRGACDLRRRLGDPEELTPVEVASVSTRARAGHVREARGILEAHIERSGSPNPDVLAALGRLSAAAGAAEESKRWMDSAIEAALAGGSRDVLLRTAVAVAESSEDLGRPEDAARAYRQALEIASVDADEYSPSPADLLAAHIGLAEVRSGSAAEMCLLEAMALVRPALRAAETWWRLPRLVSCLAASLRARPAVGREALDPEDVDGLLAAAAQRSEAEGPIADDLAFLRSTFSSASTGASA